MSFIDIFGFLKWNYIDSCWTFPMASYSSNNLNINSWKNIGYLIFLWRHISNAVQYITETKVLLFFISAIHLPSSLNEISWLPMAIKFDIQFGSVTLTSNGSDIISVRHLGKYYKFVTDVTSYLKDGLNFICCYLLLTRKFCLSRYVLSVHLLH